MANDGFDAIFAGLDKAPSTGPEESSDPFDSIFSGFDHPALPKAVANSGANPTEAAANLDLSKRSGVPPSIVEADPKNIQDNLNAKLAGQAVRQNPAIAAYVDGNSMASKVSNDDYHNLEKISGTGAVMKDPTIWDSITSELGVALNRQVDPAIAAGKAIGDVYTKRPLGMSIEQAVEWPNMYRWLQPFLAPFDALILRPPEAAARAAGAFGGQVVRQTTGDESRARMVERDLNILANGAMIEGSMPRQMTPNQAIIAREIHQLRSEGPRFTPDAEAAIRQGTMPPAGVDPLIDTIHKTQTDVDAIKLDTLFQQVQGAATHERSPELMSEYLGHVVGDQNVYIPADKILEMYHAKAGERGLFGTPDDGLFGYVPDLITQLERGMESGTDVVIPMKDFLSKTDKKVYEELKDSIRARQEGYTKEELKEIGERPAPVEEPVAAELGMEAEAKAPQDLPPVEAAVETPEAAAVKRERKALYLDPLFKDGKAVGLDQTSFGRYSRKIEAMDKAIEEKVVAAAEREAKKRLAPEWKQESARIAEEVKVDLKSRPDIAADTFLRTGELPTGEKGARVFLDKEAVESMLGKDSLKDLTKEGGVHPDELASNLGYSSGKEMLKELDLLDLARKNQGETPKAYFDRVAKQEAEIRMEAKYGSLENAISAAAREATFDRVEILAEELKILADAQKVTPPLTKEQLIAWAEQRFGEMPAKQVSYEALRRNTEKHGRDAEKALLAGKFDEAFQAKQRQFNSLLMAKAAKSFEREVRRTERIIDRFKEKTVAGVDQAFTDQIHHILEDLGIKTKRNPDELAAAKSESLRDFVEGRADAGWEFSIPEFLLERDRRTLDNLTTSEYVGLKEALQSLAHVGKENQLIVIGNRKVAFDGLKAEIIDNLQQRPARDLTGKSPSKHRYEADATLVKMETLARDFDLNDSFGPFSQSVFRAAKDASQKETVMVERVSKQVEGLKGDRAWRQGLDEKVAQDFFIDPLTKAPFDMNRGDLLNIALNFGNRSNIRKFINGYLGKDAKPMDAAVFESKMRSLLNETLRKEDWEFAQGIWDIFKDLKVDADKLYRDLSGVGMTPVKSESITTPHGDFAGGYFPIIYDKMRSNIDVIKERNPLDSHYVRATTPNGYMKARAEGFAEPIMFQRSAEHLVARLNQEIHDIASRRAVIDINKIISDKDIRSAIRLHYGPEYEAQLRPWLDYFANRMNTDDMAIGWVNSVLRKVRMNLVVQALGFNINVITSPGMGKILTGGNLATLGEVIRSPVKEWGLAVEKSQELRHTMQNMERDLHEQFRVLAQKGKWDEVQTRAAYYAMVPAAKVEQGFRVVTFLTEYRKALAEGKGEVDAVYAGEAAVRQYHGSHGRIDLAPLFRSSEGMKMLTLFQSWFNTMYNWQREIPQALRESRYMDAATTTIGAVLLPAAFGAMLFNKKHKDEKWGTTMAKALALQLAGTIPGVNQAAQFLTEGNTARMPLSSIVEGTWSAFKDSFHYIQQKKVSSDWLRHALNAPGLLAGLPTGQIAKTSQFLKDVKQRKQNPQGFGEWMHGIRTGKAKDK